MNGLIIIYRYVNQLFRATSVYEGDVAQFLFVLLVMNIYALCYFPHIYSLTHAVSISW